MAENPASRSGYRLNATARISFSRSKTMDPEFRSPISRTFSSDSIAFTKIAPEMQEGPALDYRSSNIQSKPTEGPYLWRAPLVPAQLSRFACPISRDGSGEDGGRTYVHLRGRLELTSSQQAHRVRRLPMRVNLRARIVR